MEDSVSKGNDLAKRVLESLEESKQKSQKRLYGRFILAKLADLCAIFMSLVIIGIVIYSFTEGIFEGFISTVAGYISIRHIFKKRNRSWLSWFFGWFEFNK
ncbi:MAG: hypothetical protein Q7R89_03680 [bacterium]|nr:hypothetical protein [bacterium]